MADSYEVGKVAKGTHGAIVVTIEDGQCVITSWFKADGTDEFKRTKQRVTLRNASELLALGRLLRATYEKLASDNRFGRQHRAAPVYAGAERQTSARAPSDEPDWSKVF